MLDSLTQWATLLSPIISVIAIIVALRVARSSSKDAQEQIKAIRHLLDMFIAANRGCIIRKSKFPQNPKRSVRFSGKGTKRSVQKRKARNTQKAETKVL